jgi:hypothetical protein
MCPLFLHFAMEELEQQLAALQVADVSRSSKRMPMPQAGLVLDFAKLCYETMGQTHAGSEKIRTRRVIAFFGAPPLVIAKLWELPVENAGSWPKGTSRKHLLWGLHLAKVYSSESGPSCHQMLGRRTKRRLFAPQQSWRGGGGRPRGRLFAPPSSKT